VREKLSAEIRSANETIEKRKEDIENKEHLRNRLKTSAGLQTRITMMQEGLSQGVEALKESLEKHRDKMNSFRIAVPDVLPTDSTIAGNAYAIADSVDIKYQNAKRASAKANDLSFKERTAYSNAKANLTSAKNTLSNLESKKVALERSGEAVGKAKKIMREMQEEEFRGDLNIVEEPQKFLLGLDDHFQYLEENAPTDISPEALASVTRRIRKLGKDASTCPCCSRQFVGGELKVFTDKMKLLGDAESSPLVKGNEQDVRKYGESKARAEGWKKAVQGCMPGLLEYKSLIPQIDELKTRIQLLEDTEKQRLSAVDEADAGSKAATQEESDLRDLQEAAKVCRCFSLFDIRDATHRLWFLTSNLERCSTTYCSAGVQTQDASKSRSLVSPTKELSWNAKQQTPQGRQALKRSKKSSRRREKSKRAHMKGSVRSTRSSHKQTKTSQSPRRRFVHQRLV
jgi:hypothetical protein